MDSTGVGPSIRQQAEEEGTGLLPRMDPAGGDPSMTWIQWFEGMERRRNWRTALVGEEERMPSVGKNPSDRGEESVTVGSGKSAMDQAVISLGTEEAVKEADCAFVVGFLLKAAIQENFGKSMETGLIKPVTRGSCKSVIYQEVTSPETKDSVKKAEEDPLLEGMDSTGGESVTLKESKEVVEELRQITQLIDMLGIKEKFAKKEAALLAGMCSTGGKSSMLQAEEEAQKKSEMQWQTEADMLDCFLCLPPKRCHRALKQYFVMKYEAAELKALVAEVEQWKALLASQEKSARREKAKANEEAGKAEASVTEAGRPEEYLTEAGRPKESVTEAGRPEEAVAEAGNRQKVMGKKTSQQLLKDVPNKFDILYPDGDYEEDEIDKGESAIEVEHMPSDGKIPSDRGEVSLTVGSGKSVIDQEVNSPEMEDSVIEAEEALKEAEGALLVRMDSTVGVSSMRKEAQEGALLARMDSRAGESVMRKQAEEYVGKRSEMPGLMSVVKRLRSILWGKNLNEHERSILYEAIRNLERKKDLEMFGFSKKKSRSEAMKFGKGKGKIIVKSMKPRTAKPAGGLELAKKESNMKNKTRQDEEAGKPEASVTESGRPEESVAEAGKAEEAVAESGNRQRVMGKETLQQLLKDMPNKFDILDPDGDDEKDEIDRGESAIEVEHMPSDWKNLSDIGEVSVTVGSGKSVIDQEVISPEMEDSVIEAEKALEEAEGALAARLESSGMSKKSRSERIAAIEAMEKARDEFGSSMLNQAEEGTGLLPRMDPAGGDPLMRKEDEDEYSGMRNQAEKARAEFGSLMRNQAEEGTGLLPRMDPAGGDPLMRKEDEDEYSGMISEMPRWISEMPGLMSEVKRLRKVHNIPGFFSTMPPELREKKMKERDGYIVQEAVTNLQRKKSLDKRRKMSSKRSETTKFGKGKGRTAKSVGGLKLPKKEMNMKNKTRQDEEVGRAEVSATVVESDKLLLETLAKEMADEAESFASYSRLWEYKWRKTCGLFEDPTVMSSMQFTHYTPGRIPNSNECSALETLQIISIKLTRLAGGLELPLSVYGVVAVRDMVDRNRNILFCRAMSNAQEVKQNDPFLHLIGPSRAIVFMDKVCIEVDLRVKGGAHSQNKALISSMRRYSGGNGPGVSTICFKNSLCTLELCLEPVKQTVQATILGVQVASDDDGSWPLEYGGLVACSPRSGKHVLSDSGITRTINPSSSQIVLIESKDGAMPKRQNGHVLLRRQVVSVQLEGRLDFFIKAYSKSGDTATEALVSFYPKVCNVSQKRCSLGNTRVTITVAWSLVAANKAALAFELRGGSFV